MLFSDSYFPALGLSKQKRKFSFSLSHPLIDIKIKNKNNLWDIPQFFFFSFLDWLVIGKKQRATHFYLPLYNIEHIKKLKRAVVISYFFFFRVLRPIFFLYLCKGEYKMLKGSPLFRIFFSCSLFVMENIFENLLQRSERRI